MKYVGIDFHKRYSCVARVNAAGKVLSQRKVSNDRATLTCFVRSLKPGTKLALESRRAGDPALAARDHQPS